MTPMLVLAVSLAAALLAWYACGPITHVGVRGIARAFFIALLCSPVLVIGHGFAVVPSLFGLAVQPSPYSIGPIILVWVIASGVILGVAGLRTHRNAWPPSLHELFLRAYRTKALLFGSIVAVVTIMLLYADDSRSPVIVTAQYGLVLGGSTANLFLCYWLRRRRNASLLVTPVFFAVPGVAAVAPVVPLIWYAGGVIGALIGSGRIKVAMWISSGLFAFLVVNSLMRTYSASIAPAHVTIQGGVAGNAALAAVFASLGFVTWGILSRMYPLPDKKEVEASAGISPSP